MNAEDPKVVRNVAGLPSEAEAKGVQLRSPGSSLSLWIPKLLFENKLSVGL